MWTLIPENSILECIYVYIYKYIIYIYIYISKLRITCLVFSYKPNTNKCYSSLILYLYQYSLVYLILNHIKGCMLVDFYCCIVISCFCRIMYVFWYCIVCLFLVLCLLCVLLLYCIYIFCSCILLCPGHCWKPVFWLCFKFIKSLNTGCYWASYIC